MSKAIYKIALGVLCFIIAALGIFAGEWGEIIALYCFPVPAIIAFVAYKAFQEDK